MPFFLPPRRRPGTGDIETLSVTTFVFALTRLLMGCLNFYEILKSAPSLTMWLNGRWGGGSHFMFSLCVLIFPFFLNYFFLISCLCYFIQHFYKKKIISYRVFLRVFAEKKNWGVGVFLSKI